MVDWVPLNSPAGQAQANDIFRQMEEEGLEDEDEDEASQGTRSKPRDEEMPDVSSPGSVREAMDTSDPMPEPNHSHSTRGEIRRPKTDDDDEWWFAGDAEWQSLLAAASSGDKQTKKTALNNLRKREAAGRLMETDDGVVAAVSCGWCARPGGLELTCVVDKDSGPPCAYCKRYGKSGCDARLAPKPPSLAEQLAALRKAVEEENGALRAEVAMLREELAARAVPEPVVVAGEAKPAEPASFCEEMDRLWKQGGILMDAKASMRKEIKELRRQNEIYVEALGHNVDDTKRLLRHLGFRWIEE